MHAVEVAASLNMQFLQSQRRRTTVFLEHGPALLDTSQFQSDHAAALRLFLDKLLKVGSRRLVGTVAVVDSHLLQRNAILNELLTELRQFARLGLRLLRICARCAGANEI